MTPCDLPAGLTLITRSDTTEVYRYFDGTDEARIWLGIPKGTLCVTSGGIPEIPFDVMQWLIDRGRYLADEGRADA